MNQPSLQPAWGLIALADYMIAHIMDGHVRVMRPDVVIVGAELLASR